MNTAVKIFVIILIIGILLYELLYLKQLENDVLGSLSVEKSSIKDVFAIYEQTRQDTMTGLANKVEIDRQILVKKQTNKLKVVSGATTVLGAAALFIPVAGPVVAAGLAAGSGAYVKSQGNKIQNQFNNG